MTTALAARHSTVRVRVADALQHHGGSQGQRRAQHAAEAGSRCAAPGGGRGCHHRAGAGLGGGADSRCRCRGRVLGCCWRNLCGRQGSRQGGSHHNAQGCWLQGTRKVSRALPVLSELPVEYAAAGGLLIPYE